MIRIFAAFFALSLIAGGFSSFAAADSGVGITPGKIEVNDELKAGGRYSLPPVTVINTGSKKQAYEVVMSFMNDQTGQRPSEKWLSIEPRRFELDPSQSQKVEFRVSLPRDVEPGQYFALLEAQTVSSQGQSFQPSVATKLTFSVGESSWIEATRRQVNNFLDDFGVWLFGSLGIVLVIGASKLLSRRLRFRLPFEPR